MNSFRLALLQGTAFAYIPSIQVFMQLPEYKCVFTDNDIVAASIYQNKLAIVNIFIQIFGLVFSFSVILKSFCKERKSFYEFIFNNQNFYH